MYPQSYEKNVYSQLWAVNLSLLVYLQFRWNPLGANLMKILICLKYYEICLSLTHFLQILAYR